MTLSYMCAMCELRVSDSVTSGMKREKGETRT